MSVIFGVVVVLGSFIGSVAGVEEPPVLLRPGGLIDGIGMEVRANWAVLIRGTKIEAVGPAHSIVAPDNARVVDLPGTTVLPGLIDTHTHVLLHPYNETTWDDQVLREPLALRVSRANNHLRSILNSGFTTIRDLGTEGAGYADVGLKQAVEQKIIPGPRMIVTTRAIVATGSYAPRGFAPEVKVPQGAEEADGVDLPRVVRDQIGRGADWIKVYADQWDPVTGGKATFSVEELRTVVETASALGCPVVAHAMTREGMRRAVEAGARTIEHGDRGDAELYALMKQKDVALCPTLAAAEAMEIYKGYRPGVDPEPTSLVSKRKSFKAAIEAGVRIANGSDMGVFAHGSGAREIELMVEYGLPPARAIQAATSDAARALGLESQIGTIRAGMQADLIAVEGDPVQQITALRKIQLVFKQGQPVFDPAGRVEKKP